MPLAVLALATVMALARCGGTDRNGPAADTQRLAGDSLAPEAYRTPPGFPLPFTTAVPRGFSTESRVWDEGASVTFAWRAGTRGDSAFVYLHVLPASTTEDQAREIVRTAAERLRIPGDRTELQPVDRQRWAVVEYPLRTTGRLTGRPVRGWVGLGLHRGRWFYVISQAPVDVAGTFEPRARRILSGWRWPGTDGEATEVPLDSAG
ncbi:MAG TPA: hypothetical protein VFS20_10845 [Longimicrobium sp.]|nr:hypothetical protein [Longimicrobium sp.]